MTNNNIPDLRLRNLQVTSHTNGNAAALAKHMGAIQAQDYGAAKWAIALRLNDATDATIEAAIADREIVRTWMMRGTLHFAEPENIRWMQDLTRPRLLIQYGSYLRKLELDDKTIAKSNKAMQKALQGGKQLIREELLEAVQKSGVSTDGLRTTFILNRAAWDKVICLGIRRGKQFTYTLLDEWAPQEKKLQKDEAPALMAFTYFNSHGPATAADFAWWSGLTLKTVQEAIAANGKRLTPVNIGGKTYWAGDNAQHIAADNGVHLLPAFDEYTVAYKDRGDLADGPVAASVLLGPVIVVAGRVAGTWKRTILKDHVAITTSLFAPVAKTTKMQIAAAAEHYGAYHGLPVVVK